MKKIYFLLFFVMNSVCSVVIRCKGTHSIHLIHYNDFHARFEETSDDSLICNHVNETCFGGLPRMVYEIEATRRQHPDALLLDAGDAFQGTYWYTAMKWNVTQYFINLLNHDAHAIGNHEFDDDIKGLVPYLTHLKAPALAANMDCSEEPILKGLYKPYVIVERKGRKIGIIGVTTTVTKGLAPTGNVKFTDPREAAFQVSKHLNEMGVDIIILLSHCGYPMDIEIAKNYGQYIDVIVGGHSHRDRRQIFPYLTDVKSSDTHEVLVLQADAFTKYLGSISMDFDCEGNVIGWSGGPIELDSSIPEDEKMKEELAPYAEIVHNASKEVIGYLDKAMHHSDCVHGECLMGNFLTDAIKYIAQLRLNCSRPFVSIIQRSNMRANLPKGDITQGSVVELFPYLDFLESFELRGKYIYEALERSASDLMEGKTFTGPWLLQVSGLQVIYNITKPEGHRVEALFVTDSSNSTKVPLDPDEVYQVVSPIYLSNGGDGYEMLNDNKKNPKVIGYDQHALREYIQAHKSFYVNIEGRIIIVR